MGKLTFIMDLKSTKNLPVTCVAMESVAKAENRDDIARKNGNDDYSISLEKLFNAFDTFIREHSKREHTAGQTNNYDFTDPCELTIFLLWQIRHTWTHHGGLIDKKCKDEYEKTLNSASRNGVKPIIDLPKDLEIGHEFTLQFDDYSSIKKCIFKYIGKRVTEEDLKILSNRSSITNIKVDKCDVFITYEFGTLQIDLAEAYDCSCKIDFVTSIFRAPSKMFYNSETERITISSTGKSFTAKLVKRPLYSKI